MAKNTYKVTLGSLLFIFKYSILVSNTKISGDNLLIGFVVFYLQGRPSKLLGLIIVSQGYFGSNRLSFYSTVQVKNSELKFVNSVSLLFVIKLSYSGH